MIILFKRKILNIYIMNELIQELEDEKKKKIFKIMDKIG